MRFELNEDFDFNRLTDIRVWLIQSCGNYNSIWSGPGWRVTFPTADLSCVEIDNEHVAMEFALRFL